MNDQYIHFLAQELVNSICTIACENSIDAYAAFNSQTPAKTRGEDSKDVPKPTLMTIPVKPAILTIFPHTLIALLVLSRN